MSRALRSTAFSSLVLLVALSLGASAATSAGAVVPAKKTTACKALGKAQVESYTGLTATSGVKPPAFDGETGCTWDVNDGQETVRVWVDQTKGAKSKFSANRAATPDAATVPELGSSAYSSQSGGTVTYLKGSTYVQVQYLASEKPEAEQLAGAVALAKAAMARS